MARRGSTLTPTLEFDPRLGTTGRYVNAQTGKMIPKQVIQDQLEKQIEIARRQMTNISADFANGEMSLATWRNQMAERMKIIHTQSAALSRGGWAQMTQSDWGAVGRISRDQYKFLDQFALDIQSGKQPLHRLDGELNGNFMRRVKLYADAGNSTKSEMERRQAKINQLTHEMRVLDPSAEHCQCCLLNAEKWALIGTLPKLGACECSTNDRCHFIFGRRNEAGEIVEVK